MSDFTVHHDLYHEATARRARETDAWVRDQKNRRHARRAARHQPHHGLRVRTVELMARLMGVAGEIAIVPKRPQQRIAHRHSP